MRLYEEYFKRRNIKVPVVKHVQTGVLFLRTDELSVNWLVLKINFQPHEIHPGTYSISVLKPNHNSHKDDVLFSQQTERVILNWDEYEDYVLDITNKLNACYKQKKNVVNDPKLVLLTAWEMFVFCYDSLVALNLSYCDSLVKSVDGDLSISERYRAFQDMIEILMQKHRSLYDVWNKDFMKLVRNYSYWLADLCK